MPKIPTFLYLSELLNTLHVIVDVCFLIFFFDKYFGVLHLIKFHKKPKSFFMFRKKSHSQIKSIQTFKFILPGGQFSSQLNANQILCQQKIS